MENYLSWVCTDQILSSGCMVKNTQDLTGEVGLYNVTLIASL